MLTTDLHYARALLNPYLLGEICLHNDVDVKETLNHVLQKNTNNSTTYTQALKDFVDFVENQGPFFDTLSSLSEQSQIFPTWMVGFY